MKKRQGKHGEELYRGKKFELKSKKNNKEQKENKTMSTRLVG